jgi:hypothetical protein
MTDSRLQRQALRRWLSWLSAIASATLLLIACGGGVVVGSAGVGSGGTGAAVKGPVTGFGSVFVNGVRFDDSSASITIDDVPRQSKDLLRLGMMVEIDSNSDLSLATGIAKSITTFSYAKGPISSTSLVNNTLTVLGLTIAVTPGTAFEGVQDLAGLQINNVVEVHGTPDGHGGLKATYIKLESDLDDVRLVGLVGPVKNLIPDVRTFTLYGTKVQYSPGTKFDNLPNGLTNDVVVRVKGGLVPAAPSPTIEASSIRAVTVDSLSNQGEHVEIYGIVTDFVSLDNFKVGGLTVNAASSEIQGTDPANDVPVEVEGTIDNGVLLATKVTSRDGSQSEQVELHGLVSGLNQGNKTFMLRNEIVRWNNNAVFAPPLSPTNLAGATVKVIGEIVDGDVMATSIALEN